MTENTSAPRTILTRVWPFYSPCIASPLQENFTLQLRGTKKWSIALSGEQTEWAAPSTYSVNGAELTCPFSVCSDTNISPQFNLGVIPALYTPSFIAGLPDPVSNLHVSSANRGSVAFDRRVHATYHAGHLQPPSYGISCGGSSSASRASSAGTSTNYAAADDASTTGAPAPPSSPSAEVATFTLRPGSILYTPAGLWHRVEAEGEVRRHILSL